MRANFYVYVLFRENGLPFYVGKGSGRRWGDHERYARAGGRDHRCNIIRKMFALGFREVPKIKLHEGLTEARAHEYEQALIAAIGRRSDGGPLVNLTNGGEGLSGFTFSPEHKAKLVAAHRGRKRPPATLEKMSVAARNRSPEHTAKLNATRRGRRHSPETLAKLSSARRGRPKSPEHRAKLGAAARNRPPEWLAKIGAANRTPEKRAKIAAANRTREASPETRAKLAAARRGRSHSPETRAKLAAAQRGRKASPETRAKMSAAHGKNRQLAEFAG